MHHISLTRVDITVLKSTYRETPNVQPGMKTFVHQEYAIIAYAFNHIDGVYGGRRRDARRERQGDGKEECYGEG